MITRLLVLVLMAGLATPLTAAAGEPPGDADALRGPNVGKESDHAPKSIVERDFQGRLKRLEDNPVLVAISRLDLTPEEKAAVDKVLGDRAAALDTIVRDNLRQVVELGQAKQSGDFEGAARLQADLFQKAQPFLKRGPIIAEVKAALPEDKFAQLKRMVDEYNRIGADERMTDPMEGGGGKPGEKPNRFGATIAQGFEGFGLEVKASYQRVVEAGGKDFEDLLRMLQLTPEQESHIRAKAMDLFTKTYGKPTKGQMIQFLLSMYAELDTEQRHRLAQHIGEENRVRRAPRPAAAPMDKEGTTEKP